MRLECSKIAVKDLIKITKISNLCSGEFYEL